MYKYFLLIVIVLVMGIRFLAPSDMHDNDQLRPAEYIQDLLERQHFFYQVDGGGGTASKPPMYVWIAALPTKILGYRSDFAVKSPSVLAMLLLSTLIIVWGKQMKDSLTGLLAATMLWASYHSSKLFYTNRTDMLLALFIVLSLYCIFQFWRLTHEPEKALEKGYDRFGDKDFWKRMLWVFMAFGTLTKGPVAVCVPLSVWVTLVFVSKDYKKMGHIFSTGDTVIFFAIVLAWFLPALYIGKGKFFTRVISHEIIDRVAGSGYAAKDVQPFWFLWPHFVGRFLPWSIFSLLAVFLWFRGFKFCSKETFAFLCSWIFGGMFFFSCIKGKRPDYVFPFEPAAALLVAMAAVEAFRKESRLGNIFKRSLDYGIVVFGTVGVMSALLGIYMLIFPASIAAIKHFKIPLQSSIWFIWGGVFSSVFASVYTLSEKNKAGNKPLSVIILAACLISFLPLYFFSLSKGVKEGSSELYKNAAAKLDKISRTETIFYREGTPRLFLYFLGNRSARLDKNKQRPEGKQSFILALPSGSAMPSQNDWSIKRILTVPKSGEKQGFTVVIIRPKLLI